MYNMLYLSLYILNDVFTLCDVIASNTGFKTNTRALFQLHIISIKHLFFIPLVPTCFNPLVALFIASAWI